MKKSITILCLLAVLLCVSGCKKTPSTKISGSPDDSRISETVTADQAIEMVKNIIDKESLIFSADGYNNVDGQTCHLIHAYTLSTQELTHPETGEPYYQQFTYGWYLVDIQTGAIYDYTLGEPTLIS